MTTGATSFGARLNAAARRVDNYRFVLSVIAAVVGSQAREISALRLECEGEEGQRRQLADNAGAPVKTLGRRVGSAPGD
jgi:hypothetical protein